MAFISDKCHAKEVKLGFLTEITGFSRHFGLYGNGLQLYFTTSPESHFVKIFHSFYPSMEAEGNCIFPNVVNHDKWVFYSENM